MPRAAIVACIVLLLAAAGWWSFVHDDGPPLAPRFTGAAASAPDAAIPAAAAPAAVDATAQPGDENVERTNASLAGASEQPPLPADAKWIEVLIADRTTKEPIAGADTFWADQTQWKLLQKLPQKERDAAQRDQDALAERFGWRARSDAAGKVRITMNKDGVFVMARADTRFGEAWLRAVDAPPEGHRVLLAEDRTLRVHVVDHAGRPAVGVPVALLHVGPDGKPEQFNPGAIDTGEDGVATFRHVQSRQGAMWGMQRGKPPTQWAVDVAIHKLDVPHVLVDAQAPPVEPVEIKLPPTGRLAVRLTFEGKTAAGIESLNARCGPRDDFEGMNQAWMRPVGADGFARFPYVPLGQTFFVNGWSREGGGVWNLEVDGPRNVDQEVARTIDIGGEVVVLTGRLLDGDGAPLAEQSVQARYSLTGDGGNNASVATAADGRFLWYLRPRQPDAKEPLKLEQLVFERSVENGSPQCVAVAARTLALGRNDLGELRLGVASLVVSGRFVFDSPGSSRTNFRIERFSDRPAPRNQPGAPDAAPQWRTVDELQLATQEDGTFEARGNVENGRYRIRVLASNHLPVDPVEFALGARDVQVAIRRGNELVVKCRLPEGVEALRVLLDLQRPGASKPVAAPARAPRGFGPDGLGGGDPLRGRVRGGANESGISTYRWPAVEPGTYSLRVSVACFADPFATIADVVVPQPEGGDPRLQDLDLRDAIGTLRVHVRQSEGNDIGQVIVIPQPPPAEGPWPGMTVMQEEAVLPVPKRPLDLLVARQNCRPVTLRAASGAIDVALEPWPKVEVRFTGLEALPQGATLRVGSRDPAATPGKRPMYQSDFSSGSVDMLLQPSGNGSSTIKDGVATLRCGDTPRKLTLTLSFSGRNRALKQFSPGEISAGPPITVQLDADEIRRLFEELRRPPDEKK